MPPKRTGPEREAQRARIWASFCGGSSYGDIASAERLGRSTVQMIVKQIRESGQIAARTGGGRPSMASQRCDFPCF